MNRGISRRRFIGSASAATLSFVYLPGIGRVHAQPFIQNKAEDYQGRLCYNENPLGPSPQAQLAIEEMASLSHRYPDWFSSSLESRIAAHHGLAPGNICVGAGATEIIRLIANAFLSPGDELITATTTYFQMATEATANGTTVIYVPLDENFVIDLQGMLEAIGPKTKMISLVNPNNPVATIVNKTDMEDFLAEVPSNILVIVDEAYHHYVQSPDYESCIRFVEEGLPIIVIKTFSKAHGLAGARIGYSLASSHYTGIIASSQLFGTVSRASQAAAEAALGDPDHVNKTIALNNNAKYLLETGFNNLNLDYIPSETNFIMFDTGTNAGSVASELNALGYQVRTGWGMPQHIRISTGLIDEMQGFLEALESILPTVGTVDNRMTPETFALRSIYPNPFNSRCHVKISTLGEEKVQLTIYDIKGRKVRSPVNGPLQPGMHNIVWDGKDYHGKKVASGTYVINLVQGEFANSRRVSFVK